MGIINDLGSSIDDIDFDEPHTERGFGFDPSVCDGCEHHDTERTINTCTLCGCPTPNGSPMQLLGMPPERCPRLPEHESDA